MSTHSCPVVEVKMGKHPDADALSIVKIDGYEVIIRTEEWNDGDIAVYIPPDYIVPNNELFSFLNGHTHIKVRKYRGRYSQGLLIQLPSGFDLNLGDNAMKAFGIVRYEPLEPITMNDEDRKAPSGIYPKYDVENAYKYLKLFDPGEPVIVTEKIHGANARFTYINGVMHCGSRTRWKQLSGTNLWWKAVNQNTWILDWCANHPGLCLYGEVFGQVQDLKYGANANQIFFRVFDIWHIKEARWIDFVDIFTEHCGLLRCDAWVPIVHHGKFDINLIKNLAEQDSVIPSAKHCAEGVVVRSIQERHHPKLGRVQLKFVSNRYLSKGK